MTLHLSLLKVKCCVDRLNAPSIERCSQFFPGQRWVAALKGIAAIALAYAALQLLTNAITRVFAPRR
jgi:hypothetical protein